MGFYQFGAGFDGFYSLLQYFTSGIRLWWYVSCKSNFMMIGFGKIVQCAMVFGVKIQIQFVSIFWRIFFCYVFYNTHWGKNPIYPKIHILKTSFLTKFTTSKSHFSQNSPFQSVIFPKIHCLLSGWVDVNFETFDDAFLLLENSHKFLPILFMLYNWDEFSRGKKAFAKVF